MDIKISDTLLLTSPRPNIKHAIDLIECYQDNEMRKFLTPNCTASTIEEAQELIRYYESLNADKIGLIWFLIDTANDNKFIGSFGFNTIDNFNRKADISYEIHKNYRNLGISTKTLKKIIEYGFNELQLQRIEANCTIDNIASQKLLENLGFEKEGVLRKYKYIRGENQDSFIYSVVKV